MDATLTFINAALSCFAISSLQAAGADGELVLSVRLVVDGCDAGAGACVALHPTRLTANRERTIRFIAAPPKARFGENASTATTFTGLLFATGTTTAAARNWTIRLQIRPMQD